jgi:hypothetical protein
VGTGLRSAVSERGTLRRVALVRTDVSGDLSASFIRVTRIGEVRTTLAVTINRRTLAYQPRPLYEESWVSVLILEKIRKPLNSEFSLYCEK